MKSGEFFKQIRENRLQNVYLLCGEEEYGKDRALEEAQGTIEEVTRDFNLSVLTSPGIDELIDACEALPLMAERRMVVARECGFLGGKEEGGEGAEAVKRLAAYLPNICPSTCLIFFQRGSCDKRKALYKACDKLGGVVEFDAVTDEEAARWAAGFAKRQGVLLGAEQARRLVMMSGRKIADVAAQTQKVCDYAGAGAVVTFEMLDKCVSKNLEYTVFEMMDHFVAGRTAKAFEMLRAELSGAQPGKAFMTMGFFAKRLQNMLQISRLKERGMNEKQIAQQLGMNEYAVKMTAKDAGKFSRRQLEDAVLAFAQADYNAKSGKEKDTAALERVLLQVMCGPNGRG
jgi:DNA polymerase-3 subunit delta